MSSTAGSSNKLRDTTYLGDRGGVKRDSVTEWKRDRAAAHRRTRCVEGRPVSHDIVAAVDLPKELQRQPTAIRLLHRRMHGAANPEIDRGDESDGAWQGEEGAGGLADGGPGQGIVRGVRVVVARTAHTCAHHQRVNAIQNLARRQQTEEGSRQLHVEECERRRGELVTPVLHRGAHPARIIGGAGERPLEAVRVALPLPPPARLSTATVADDKQFLAPGTKSSL